MGGWDSRKNMVWMPHINSTIKTTISLSCVFSGWSLTEKKTSLSGSVSGIGVLGSQMVGAQKTVVILKLTMLKTAGTMRIAVRFSSGYVKRSSSSANVELDSMFF